MIDAHFPVIDDDLDGKLVGLTPGGLCLAGDRPPIGVGVGEAFTWMNYKNGLFGQRVSRVFLRGGVGYARYVDDCALPLFMGDLVGVQNGYLVRVDRGVIGVFIKDSGGGFAEFLWL